MSANRRVVDCVVATILHDVGQRDRSGAPDYRFASVA